MLCEANSSFVPSDGPSQANIHGRLEGDAYSVPHGSLIFNNTLLVKELRRKQS